MGANTGGKSDAACESVLTEAGLGGAAVYDLRELELEVANQLTLVSNDELGVGSEDEEDEEFAEEMRAVGVSAASESAASLADPLEKQVARRSSQFRAPGRLGQHRPSAATLLAGRGRLSANRLSAGSDRLSGDRRSSRASEFERRASRLSGRRTSISAGINAVATKDSIEEANLYALIALDERQLLRPRPTPVSDLDLVFGWLSRHLDGSTVAQYAPKRDEGEGQQSSPAHGSPSEMEGMLSKWKLRAQAKVAKSDGVDESPTGAPSRGGGVGSSPSRLGGGGWRPGWEARADEYLGEDVPAEVRANVFERQKALEQTVDAKIVQRQRERKERQAMARRARRARNLGLVGMGDGLDSNREDESESEEEEEEEGGLPVKQLTDAARVTRKMRRGSIAAGADESIHKFVKQLPFLEQKKELAKKAVFEAEHALKNQLGRRPLEIERREDENWIRAAIQFKEADQALFVARSLTNWDD